MSVLEKLDSALRPIAETARKQASEIAGEDVRMCMIVWIDGEMTMASTGSGGDLQIILEEALEALEDDPEGTPMPSVQ